MKKKIIALLGVTALVLGLFAGCGNEAQQMTESATDVSTSAEMTTEQSTTAAETTSVAANDVNANVDDTADFITEKEATDIALKKVPGAKETDVRIHMDRDDGIDIYEGSIVYDEMEYDFEIDAKTGKVLEWESESIYD